MNNKGFAISAVLYTLLIAFLLFLGVTLAVFKSSARTIGNSNNDIIDGKKLRVSLVKMDDEKGEDGNVIPDKKCIPTGTDRLQNQHYWYELSYDKNKLPNERAIYNQTIIKIDSIKGPMFWPRDFGLELGLVGDKIQLIYKSGFDSTNAEIYKDISVKCLTNGGDYETCYGKNINDDNFTIQVYLNNSGSNTQYIGGYNPSPDPQYIQLYDFCE